jgi:spoIIIJ-associated protein
VIDMIEKTGKTVEEAIEAALAELGLERDQVDYRVLEAPSKPLFGLLGGREAKVEVTIKKVEPIERAKLFIEKVTKAMNLLVTISVISNDDAVTLNLKGDDLGILIGKHGQTLDALQYLSNLVANREGRERIRFIIDVEDYRKRRADTLQQLALRLADRVKRSGDRVVLEPMTPHERKIIHMSLQEDLRIETYSEGEEPFRRVVIVSKRG